jgi:hypothetical protein
VHTPGASPADGVAGSASASAVGVTGAAVMHPTSTQVSDGLSQSTPDLWDRMGWDGMGWDGMG